jgi:hypothetical protein
MPGEDLKSGFWSKFGKMLFADFSRLLIKNIVYFGAQGANGGIEMDQIGGGGRGEGGMRAKAGFCYQQISGRAYYAR